ncbi:hypothetical protein VTJ83DRAFT_2498 [Remersonia thermophila]|uniref:Uncharacterized protein n=1 Tax=Remersonia thermophila TaxID=72144 RepID=A0ABR4DLZ3_9PEZI
MASLFSDSERRFILAEMIKLSKLDVSILVEFVKEHRIQPDWMHMQLPVGRNMEQCVHAAEAMLDMPIQPPIISALKRKSLEEPPEFAAAKRQAMSSGQPSPHPLHALVSPPAAIQQRPNGSSLASSSASTAPISYVPPTPPNPAPTRRPRGRPPKQPQPLWQAYHPIAPSATPSQPHSPGVQAQTQPPRRLSAPALPDPTPKRETLPRIAPRPAAGAPASAEPAAQSPSLPSVDYQRWRDETMRKDYYQVQPADHTLRDRPQYPPILPRPESPYPPPRDMPRTQSTEPRQYTATPPTGAAGSSRKASHDASSEQNRT